MQNFKKGFTLAEVLLALTIVGVIAAMTIPTLVKNIEKQKAGPILGRAVHQIELGCQNLIQDTNSETAGASHHINPSLITFKDVKFDNTSDFLFLAKRNADFGKVIAKYIGGTQKEIDWDDVPSIKNFDGSVENVLLALMIKKGVVLKFGKTPAEASFSPRLTISDKSKWIFIDVNGWEKAPNTFGKDVFEFDWDDDTCKLTPYTPSANNGLQYTKQVVKDGFKIKYY